LLQENVIKIILLGDSAVGKSKLVERFLMNEYQPRQVTPPVLCSARLLLRQPSTRKLLQSDDLSPESCAPHLAQLSTFALTLFRHVGVVGGEEYKVRRAKCQRSHRVAVCQCAPHWPWGSLPDRYCVAAC